MTITKLLVANRGEIGCRIIKTCKRLGIKTVSVFSDADRHALHTKLSQPHLSYLKIKSIIDAAQSTKSNAIHPGYGFLSESHEFADLCESKKITFIGPPSSAIKNMGLKNLSKQIMEKANVPVIPGYHKDDQSLKKLRDEARKIGYPVMIKAVRGGGGKGMRICLSDDVFEEMLDAAKRESKKAFNDDEMILEKYIQNPRHVEVQIFGDKKGNYVYLWERDCSIQRRHQKVLEEAPAPNIRAETRSKIGEAAVNAARAVNYVGAGTVEFVMDREENFYFMEMNTRLQVEHPVSESITNIDFVEWQLRVANGEELPIKNQKEIPLLGHAFEARIYAEDCSNPSEMLPTAGKIEFLQIPKSAGLFEMSSNHIRIDKAIMQDQEISVFYDPMIAKLITWGQDRKEALNKMKIALNEFKVLGLPNNIEFLKKICVQPDVENGILDTGFILNNLDELKQKPIEYNEIEYDAIITAMIYEANAYENAKNDPFYSADFCVEKVIQFSKDEKKVKAKIEKKSFDSIVVFNGEDSSVLKVHSFQKSEENVKKFKMSVENVMDGKIKKINLYKVDSKNFVIEDESEELTISFSLDGQEANNLGDVNQNSKSDPNIGEAPMPGIIEKVLVKVGDKVSKNQPLVTMIAMKMEYTIRAPFDGEVESIMIKEGEGVSKGQTLTKLRI